MGGADLLVLCCVLWSSHLFAIEHARSSFGLIDQMNESVLSACCCESMKEKVLIIPFTSAHY